MYVFFLELWLKLLLLTFLNVLNGGITIFLGHNLFIIFIDRLNKGFTFKPLGLAMMEKAKKIFHKKSLTNEIDSIIREESQNPVQNTVMLQNSPYILPSMI